MIGYCNCSYFYNDNHISPIPGLQFNITYLTLFYCTAGESITVATSTRKDYRQFWIATRDKTSLVFSVKACAAVSVALSAIPGVSGIDTYEIVIGGPENDVTAIRDSVDGPNQSELRTTGILVCDTEMHFWMSWERDFIEVGRGSVVKDQKIIDWKPTKPHAVSSVSITTDFSQKGIWRFNQVDGM